MAGSSKTMRKGKKRKLTDPVSEGKPLKSTRRTNDAVKEKEAPSKMVLDEVTPLINGGSRQWRSLELALSTQNKQLSNHQKVELIYEFVKSRACKEDNDTEHEFFILSMSQLITNLSSWIQSLLFKSEREIRDGDKESEESRLCLDHRCWEVMKFCFEESTRLHVSLSLSRDLLKVFSCVAINALNSIKSVHTDSKGSIFIATEFQLYNTVNNCIKLIVSSHGRLLNENLDSWAVAVNSVLELVIEVYGDNLEDNDVGTLMTQFSCLVLELFAKFVKLHPCRKNAFRDFVDKLLEPLLHVLGLLCDQIRGSNPLMQNLLKLVQEILSYGLFHSVHLDEYLTFHSTEKYSSSANGTLENRRTLIKSYHRHLFDKLEVFISERKVGALSGVGEMFYLFVDCMRKQKRNSLNAESSRGTEDHSTKPPTKTCNLTSEKRDPMNTAISDLTKSGFDFFVLTLEPLLLDLSRLLQSNLQTGTSMLDFHHILKCVNKILSIMIRESLYSRMEGDFGGACLNFFKIIYGLLLSCYSKFNKIWQSKSGIDRFPQVEILNSVAKEFILAVSSFLQIEYELVGDGLVEIWLMILTILAVAHSLEDSSLISETIDLGCRILNLYSELRQVHQAIFTLCRGLRHLRFYLGDDEMRNSELSASSSIFYYDEFAAAGRLLLCSQKFRLAIMHAVKSIPEGQVGGCVQALRDDMSDTLAWMRVVYLVTNENEFGDANSCKFSAQAELFGIVLSEIYSVILDSLSISAGNSYLTSVSIKNLIELMQASTTKLIALEQEGVDEFLLSVTGITFQSNTMEHRKYFQDKIPLIALFFFRLYATCRSLYRQTLSLMPPGSSRKMSGAMADFYTAYSGQDCIERADFEDGGYFSWIGEASVSLLRALQFIKDNFLQKGSLDYSSLIYVMLIMALQRLVDLNRQIWSLEYIEQRNNNDIQNKSMDEADLIFLPNEKRKLGILLSDWKQEAAGLSGFMMEYLSLIDEEQLFSKLNGKTSDGSSPRYLEVESWDLGVCTLNKKTLPTAIWWIICQNVDTWCNHATKKKLKLFVKLLVASSLPHERCREFQNPIWEPCNAINVTKQQISQEQLQDTTLYDERSVCRYIPSTLCNIFKMYLSVLFEDSSSIDTELSSSDWEKVLSSMSQRAIPGSSYSACSDLIDGCCDQQSSSSSIGLPIAACQYSLDLLCHMIEGSLNSKSFSRCMIYLVNCERHVLESLSDPRGKLCLHKYQKLLRLFVSCRKALKYLLLTFCEKSKLSKSSRRQKISKSSLPTLWLLKSVSLVVMWGSTSSLGCDGGHVNDIIYSLMNHTSYIFHTFCKHNFGLAIQSILAPRGDKSIVKSPKDVEVCENLTDVVVMLKDQTKSCLLSLKEAFNSGNADIDAQLPNLNDLCSVAYGVQGFLWGLESTLSDVSASGSDLTAKMLKRRCKTIYGINNFIELFVEFMSICSQIFLCDDQLLNTSCEDKEQLNNDIDNDALETEVGSESENENQDGKPGKIPLTSSHVQNDFGSGCRKRRLPSDNVHTCIGGLSEFSLFNYSGLKIELLQNFLSGQNLESAFLLRGLFIASSAIIKLGSRIGCSLPSNLVQFFLGCSEVLLMEFSCMCDMPKPLSFVWLDGPFKFLETLGAHFPSTSVPSTRDVYVRLVKLHLNTIGKCISLQGKGATLVSHDIESSNKLSEGQDSESIASGLYGLHELKARLRMSFRVFIERPSELHLSSAVQTLQSALVGVQDGCTATYEVKMNSGDGGVVSPLVAAGVDCLDIILEFVKGQKPLDLMKKNINNLIASLINIVVHLQGLTLFYRNPISDVMNKNPDSGSVVVMCVEVLTRIAGKPALFNLDCQHVAQSLHMPATLFQGFCNLRAGKSFYPSLAGFVDSSKESDQPESCVLVDRQFSINLYAASCKLLWTVVKHQKSKCVRFISLVQYSLQALLHCLEIVNVDSTDRNGYFSWQVEEGAKCASYLRRVYEEIRQQKEVLGRHCFMFLSDYIWLYSGNGPLKRGIKREVDEALKPGVYALVDVCTADDLQYLHTVFGEGPCRSTLASLQHAYKLHFQYEGKV